MCGPVRTENPVLGRGGRLWLSRKSVRLDDQAANSFGLPLGFLSARQQSCSVVRVMILGVLPERVQEHLTFFERTDGIPQGVFGRFRDSGEERVAGIGVSRVT